MKRVGIRDVASRAGVSMSSVSNALNRPERVSDEIVERVRAAVADLGYVPLQAAQQLRIGRSGLLGMTVINITNPFFGDLVSGAEDATGSSGARVLVGNSDDDEKKERDYFELFKRVQVEGALVSPFGDAGEALARELGRSVPVVLVDRVDDEGVLDSVSFDDVAGGRMAAEHLIELGRTRLAFIGAREEVRQVRERLAGARDAVARHPGVRLDATWIPRTSAEYGVGVGIMIAGLPPGERPDGIVTTNDHLACGVVHGLLRGGMRVPDDVAVVGYDDIEFAAVAAVPLTSVRQPAREMGRVAAQQLLRLVSGEVQATGRSIRFEPELAVRASTVGYR
ncbi:LacI family DNA-binding transcriptional regulator [Microbacterium sp. SS28]|uniref:LacI family DNA-binding transcriptional regulator n=1 Tax=Microbacterium sp. SS28 TaxID=2919948 RepID=UPI00242D3049|nr:LacI family DNA-binding transcriptional regulator [Microbacterium sp. SS28]